MLHKLQTQTAAAVPAAGTLCAAACCSASPACVCCSPSTLLASRYALGCCMQPPSPPAVPLPHLYFGSNFSADLTSS
jgi:hypothetical protein